MSEMISFQDSVNDSLYNDRLLMDDKLFFSCFFDNIQDDNSLKDDDMNGIFKKNIDSTDFKSDKNNIILSPDNQLKKEKDMNKLKENEEKHMNDIKEESELKYNKDGTLQKKRGRKKLNEEVNEEDIIHKKTDKDNIIYKLKVNCLKNWRKMMMKKNQNGLMIMWKILAIQKQNLKLYQKLWKIK